MRHTMYKYWRLLIFTWFALVIASLGLAACATVPAQRPSTRPVQAFAPTVTMAPILTITIPPAKKPLASVSPPIMPTFTLQPLLKGPLIAFIASDAIGKGYILILDSTTGSTRRFQWTANVPVLAEWWADGCGLNVTLITSSGVELVSTTLHNDKPQKVFSGGQRADGSFATWPVLSPDKKWVAYTVFSGKQQYLGAEFQNIEVAAVEDPDRPFILTKYGGAWKAAWSPHGEHLAYSDYDTAGAVQLYRSKPDGSERVQLTHFKMDGMTIGPARWSPQGDRIVFAVYQDDGTGSVWIVSTDGSEQFEAAAKGAILETDDFWWDEDGLSFAFYAPKNEKQSIGEDAIYWISIVNGEVLHVLEASKTTEGYIAQAFPVGGIRTVGFTGSKGVFFYDMVAETTEEKKYANVEMDDLTGPIYTGPTAFQGETSCQSR